MGAREIQAELLEEAESLAPVIRRHVRFVDDENGPRYYAVAWFNCRWFADADGPTYTAACRKLADHMRWTQPPEGSTTYLDIWKTCTSLGLTTDQALAVIQDLEDRTFAIPA
jgi:hypothetical protein